MKADAIDATEVREDAKDGVDDGVDDGYMELGFLSTEVPDRFRPFNDKTARRLKEAYDEGLEGRSPRDAIRAMRNNGLLNVPADLALFLAGFPGKAWVAEIFFSAGTDEFIRNTFDEFSEAIAYQKPVCRTFEAHVLRFTAFQLCAPEQDSDWFVSFSNGLMAKAIFRRHLAYQKELGRASCFASDKAVLLLAFSVFMLAHSLRFSTEYLAIEEWTEGLRYLNDGEDYDHQMVRYIYLRTVKAISEETKERQKTESLGGCLGCCNLV